MQQKLKTIILFVLCMSFLSQVLFAKPVIINLSRRTPSNSALRSVIFPGWGQIYNKEKPKGYIIGASSLLCITSSYLMYDKANESYKKYDNLGVKNSSLYFDYEDQYNRARYLAYFGVGIWVYSIIDAYINAKKYFQGTAYLKKDGVVFDFSNSRNILRYRKTF